MILLVGLGPALRLSVFAVTLAQACAVSISNTAPLSGSLVCIAAFAVGASAGVGVASALIMAVCTHARFIIISVMNSIEVVVVVGGGYKWNNFCFTLIFDCAFPNPRRDLVLVCPQVKVVQLWNNSLFLGTTLDFGSFGSLPVDKSDLYQTCPQAEWYNF